MYKILLGLCLSFSAFSSTPFKENETLTVDLSDSNYNRLVVKDDKIQAVHFREGMMAVSHEADGAMYVIVNHPDPFTVFVTTEAGRHFALTVNKVSSLGKTIEFMPKATSVPPPDLNKITPPSKAEKLLSAMMHDKVSKRYQATQYYGRAIRLQEGMSLFPKKTYQGRALKGEVMEIYNGSQKPMNLELSLFKKEGVSALALSKYTLAPHERGLMYRVLEQPHGTI